jgi:hypothetical protein
MLVYTIFRVTRHTASIDRTHRFSAPPIVPRERDLTS